MKNILKDKKILFGMMLGIIFIISTSVTYAWFSLTVSGNEEAKQIKVETGTLSLVYKDGVEIEGINVHPGWSQTKTFTVTNTGTFDTEYNMIFKDLINQIQRNELVVSYTCTSYTGYVDENNKGTVSGTCNSITEQAVPLSEGTLSSTITENISIGVGITHEYTLTLLFKEMNAEQNYNQGKDVNTEINITQVINNGSATRGNIYNVLLADNPTIKNDSADLFADVADEVSESGLFRTTDLTKTENGQEVLYFRGVVENNYLVFAGFCWRIVRTNESGESIKLRYGGEYDIANNTCPQTGTNVGIIVNGTNRFQYSVPQCGTINLVWSNSNAKTMVETWYTQNIETQGSSITDLISDEPYCNDMSIVSGNNDYDRENYGYGITSRTTSPQYKCEQESDKYSVGKGNISKPIALLTSDELLYSGSSCSISNDGGFYNDISYIYWTMTPVGHENDGEMCFGSVHVFANPLEAFGIPDSTPALLPVISLSNTANIAEGTTGEYNNPYIVVTE